MTNRLSDNYYHRKCYMKRNQVPTQTVMKDKMSVPLANVYFKSMTPKLKVLAGLEPRLQGGGAEWYMPPDEMLAGRAVLKPLEKEYLNKLGFDGINQFGEKLCQRHHRAMLKEKKLALEESDRIWKQKILDSNRKHYQDCAKEVVQNNTKMISSAVREFQNMYTTSVTNIETLIYDAAIAEIKRIREDVFQGMKARYEQLLDYQATMLYDKYNGMLQAEKARLKAEFIENVENVRTDMGNRIHDIKIDTHMVTEKLRHFLECQSMACQVYVALKEREECKEEMDLSDHLHQKKVKELQEEIALKDFEIRLETEQQLKRQKFIRIWRKKICHIVKKFQIFVEYCLKILPNHAEFFINMEKLMMLQLNEASENPSAESIIKTESGSKSPVPRPYPYYLFCDKGFTPNLEQQLCPKHCTASATQMPVVVINKRCFYSACDNFKVFHDKVTQYLSENRGDDADFEDHHKYELDVPVKLTCAAKLDTLKLESSLMQILQQELPNVQELPIECSICKIPYCFCSPLHRSQISLVSTKPYRPPKKPLPKEEIGPGNTIQTRIQELEFERQPKWESYLDFVAPKRCKCAKMAKKHLKEYLPPYMRNMSPFEPPELPNYETCKLSTLKKLVKQARGIKTPPPPPEIQESKTRDIATQYSDREFDYLCNCFSDDEIAKLFEALLKGSKMFEDKLTQTKGSVVDGSITPTFLADTASSFATHRAYSLRNLIGDAPELEELFRRSDCNF